MQILRVLFLSMLLLFGGLGCQKKEPESNSSVLLEAYRLIDSNRLDEAIALLDQELSDRDKNSDTGRDSSAEAAQLRVTMASALVKKSGITIREIAQFVNVAIKVSGLALVVEDKRRSGDMGKTPVGEFTEAALHLVKQSQMMSVIPVVAASRSVYLFQAVRVLSLNENMEPGDLIYSALVKVIAFRTALESDELQSILPQVVEVDGVCVAKVDKFRDHFKRAVNILLSGLVDLDAALPEQRSEIRKSSKSMVEVAARISSLSSAGAMLSRVDTQSFSQLLSSLHLQSPDLKCAQNP